MYMALSKKEKNEIGNILSIETAISAYIQHYYVLLEE